MEQKIKKLGEICFWIAIVTEVFLVLLDKSDYIVQNSTMIFRFTCLLFGVKILCTKYTRKQWIIIIGVGLLTLVSYLVNGREEVPRAAVLVFACKDIDIQKLIKRIFWITLAGCLTIIILSITGIYGNICMVAYFGTNDATGHVIETRYTLGMGHPNALQCMVLMLTVIGTYCYKEKIRWWNLIILLGINVLFYMITDSRTGILTAIAYVAGLFYVTYVKDATNKKYIYVCGFIILLMCVAFSLAGAGIENTYDTPDSLMHKIDLKLNGRFQCVYAVEGARLMNWKLFATRGNDGIFDPAFDRLGYWYGIVPLVLYVWMNIYLIYQSYKKKDYMLLVMIAAFSVYSVMEAHLIYLYLLRNYLFLFAGCYLTSEDIQKERYIWKIAWR